MCRTLKLMSEWIGVHSLISHSIIYVFAFFYYTNIFFYKCKHSPGSGGHFGVITLDEDVHWGGPWSEARLHRTHVLAFIWHVHVFNLDGKLVLIEGHQTHSGIHWPFVFSGVQYTRPVEPRCVCDNVPLCAPVKAENTAENRPLIKAQDIFRSCDTLINLIFLN